MMVCWKMFSLLVVVLSTASADYQCVCSYKVEIPVFEKPDESSMKLGHLYEFDCKPITSAPGSKLQAIVYSGQIAYVQTGPEVRTQTCQGKATDVIKPTPISAFVTTVTPDSTITTGSEIPTTTSSVSNSTHTPTLSTMDTRANNKLNTTWTTSPITTPSPTASDTTTLTMAAPSVTSPPATPTSATTPTTIQTTTKTPSTIQTTTPTSATPPSTIQTTTPTSATTPSTMQTTTPTSATTPTTIQATTPTSATTPSTIQATTPTSATTSATTTPTIPMSTTTTTKSTSTTQTGFGQLNRCPNANVTRGLLSRLDNHCYELMASQPSDWYFAQADCAHKGGTLLVVANERVQKFVTWFLTALQYDYPVWIGLHDIVTEDKWTWVNGASLSKTGYTNWRAGHKDPVLHYDQDCVVMEGTSGTWREHVCKGYFLNTQRHPWICQYDTL